MMKLDMKFLMFYNNSKYSNPVRSVPDNFLFFKDKQNRFIYTTSCRLQSKPKTILTCTIRTST